MSRSGGGAAGAGGRALARLERAAITREMSQLSLAEQSAAMKEKRERSLGLLRNRHYYALVRLY